MDRERRRHKRYSVKEVYGSLLYSMDITILDISMNGMKIESARRLDVGKKYSFRIKYEGKRVNLKGHVIWCILSGSSSSGSEETRPVYQAGVELDGILTDAAGDLQDFLKEHVIIKLEERLFGRFRFNLKDPVNMNCEYDFLVKQLSLSGMLIETELLPDVGSRFNMEVRVGDRPLAIQGRVAYAKQVAGDETRQLSQIGIEFIEVSDLSRSTLEQIIKSGVEL